MKDWQKGYELDYLKGMESRWERYNSYSKSPFTEQRKDKIAKGLDAESLVVSDNYVFETKVSKTEVPIKMFRDVIVAKKMKGDRTVEKLEFDWDQKDDVVEALKFSTPTWLYIWQEDVQARYIADTAGYKCVGTKFTSFAEIYGIWFRDNINPFFGEREHPEIIREENYTMAKASGFCVDPESVKSIRKKLDLLPEFENHYSNYNKGASWSAISLRGYSDNPNFITKPEEMNKKWHEKHKDQEFKMQDTYLREQFPEVDKLLEWVDTPIHRIRFMKLVPGGGTLERHTDQTDPDSGVTDGKLMRFHWPIMTNWLVKFTVWNKNGLEHEVHMMQGDCWYIDVRKPHRAINDGKGDRIHLVVDVEASDTVRGVMSGYGY